MLIICHIRNSVTLGLKPGVILSPLVFILFINDIKRCIDHTKLTTSDIERLSIYILLKIC